MKFKKIIFILFLLLCIFECKGEIILGKKDLTNVEDSLFSAKTYTEQEINYIAPQSGSVFLVWKTLNHPLKESVLWNENTRLYDSLLYIPMELKNDTFTIRLQVPKGSEIEYYFRITKNKEGAYQDFWDLQSSGKLKVTEASSILKNANYSKAEETDNPNVLSKGWLILLLLIIGFMFLRWIQKKLITSTDTPSKIEKLLFLALSLWLFHALARAEIINVNPLEIIYSLKVIYKIIRGSSSDFIYVFTLVFIFVFTLYWIKNSKIQNLVYGTFLIIAVFSVLVAFINITTVAFFGTPFSYQWLYYSEFFGGTEAKTVLKENLSLNILVNLCAFCVSVFILSNILNGIYRLLLLNKQIKYISFSIIGLLLIVLFIKVKKIDQTWTGGQSANAITSMIFSIVNANSNSSFFTAKIKDEFEPFNPAQGTKIELHKQSLKDHKVKNVLFIILESAGAVYFDSYGGTYQLSPNLNKYESHALKFEQMYANLPATDRTLVSLLGSMYPYLSYKSITKEAPDIDYPTISSVLKNEGYKTSFFTSADISFQDCDQFLAHRGFDTVEDFSTIKCNKQFKLDLSNYKQGNGIDDMCLLDRLTSWLDEGNPKQNFFSLIWTVQGHYPYFFAKEEEDFGVSDYQFNSYLNCLKYNDELIGNIMKALEIRGLDSTTLVIVTGDHGEAFGQHGENGHGSRVYEEFVKVPLYLINPTLFHGESKGDIVGMKDLASTALSIINVDVPTIWQGRNILTTDSDETFLFAALSGNFFGYRKNNMKYIFNESNGTVEVFDLNSDKDERINLIQTIPQEELDYARNRVASWVQYQDKFISDILEGQYKENDGNDY